MTLNLEPKLYTNISYNSLRLGIEQEYRLWAIMRSYIQKTYGNAKGVTMVHTLDPVEFRSMLKLYGFNRKVYYNFIERNQNVESNVFFTFNKNNIGYRSLEKVCNTLEIMPGHAYRVDVEKLVDLTTFRAYCFYGFYANHINNTMCTREEIETQTGVTKPTQIKYERLLGIEKYHTYFLVDADKYNEGIDIPENVIENIAYRSITLNGNNMVLFQTANIYLAYVSHIELFNDKEIKRIYKKYDERYNKAYRKNTLSPQFGKRTTQNQDSFVIKTIDSKETIMRGIVANEMDSQQINSHPYLKSIVENSNGHTRIYTVINYNKLMADSKYFAFHNS